MPNNTKKQRRTHNPSTVIEHAGKKIRGTSLGFHAEEEPWNVYRLSNGARLKIKLILSDVVVTKEKVAGKTPLVICRMGNLIIYEPKKK